MIITEGLTENIIQGEESKVIRLVQQAVQNKIPVKEILNDGLIAAMNVVGMKFKDGELFVPEVLRAARAMKAGMGVLRPFFEKSGIQSIGKVVIGTVQGDLHDIGKNLVAMMVESNGFEVIDLGVDVPPEKFVEALKTNQADVCMMSALLTTTMPMMKETIDAIQEAGLREKVKTMVGGAPVTQHFADTIGADGYGSNAGAAVEMLKILLARPS